MNILITGGSGFTGKYIIDALFGTANLLIIGQNKALKKVSTLQNNEVSYQYTDYTEDNLAEIFKAFKPSAVIHLAAQRPIKENSSEVYISNLRISQNLFKVSLEFSVKNIVNISSKSVYSDKNITPWSELDFPVPSNEYGLSKVWVEDAARLYSNKGLHIKSLRLAQVIGLGEREGYVLQTYLENARAGKPLKVYGNSIGKRQYVYVKDVAKAVLCALNNEEVSGVFNISMSSNYSFMDLALCINRVFKNDGGIDHLSDLPADESNYQLDISKASNELNWKPVFDLEATYRDIKADLKYFKNDN